MNIKQLTKYHPSIAHPEEMRMLCNPLKKLGITYFGHARFNEQGELATNASNPGFLENYYRGGLYNFDLHHTDKKPRYVLWDLVTPAGKSQELYQTGIEFGLCHTFSVMEYDGNVKNCYHFATKPGNTFMNDFYIQHIDLLEKFVHYFKDQLLVNDRLHRAYKMVTTVNTKDAGYLTVHNLTDSLLETDVGAFLQSIGVQYTKRNAQQAQLILTRREQQCAHYLLEGKTAKEIADHLHISSRTVEIYLDRLKKRFGSKNKIQLVRQLTEKKIRTRKVIEGGRHD